MKMENESATTIKIPSLAGCYVLMMAAVADSESDVHNFSQSVIANLWYTLGNTSNSDEIPWPNLPCVLVMGQLNWSGCIKEGIEFHREFPVFSDDKDDAKGVRFSLTEKGKLLGERLQAALEVDKDVDLLSLAKKIMEE